MVGRQLNERKEKGKWGEGLVAIGQIEKTPATSSGNKRGEISKGNRVKGSPIA